MFPHGVKEFARDDAIQSTPIASGRAVDESVDHVIEAVGGDKVNRAAASGPDPTNHRVEPR
jgi:hypothetical protein